MEHLTKQQIVLLTLLVSFVTSLATGIFTVSLMDQGSFDITQVVNKVEKTVVEAPPTTAAVVEPTLAEITSKVAKTIVRLKPTNGSAESVLGIGIILSQDGLFLTDKSALGQDGKGIVAVLPGGQEVPIQVVQSQILGDIAFVAALLPKNTTLTPVILPSNLASTKLGDNVYALSGKQTSILEPGILKSTPVTPEDKLSTTIDPKNILVGSPLFTSKGEVIGFKTASLEEDSSFYPLPALKSIMPQFSR